MKVGSLLKPYSKKPGGAASAGDAPRSKDDGAGPITTMLENAGNAMVLLAMGGVVIATVLKVAWLTPIIHAASVFPFFYPAMKEYRYRWALILVIRWAAAIFFTTIVLGVFVPARMDASLPLSARTIDALQGWLAGSGSPPVDYAYILWGLAAFLVGSVISGGLAGFLVGSVAIGAAASGALFLFEHGNNVLQIALVALPIWQWSLFACGTLLLVPTARLFFDRFLRTERVSEDKQILRAYMFIGSGCFVLSLLLRLSLGGVVRDVILRWTIL